MRIALKHNYKYKDIVHMINKDKVILRNLKNNICGDLINNKVPEYESIKSINSPKLHHLPVITM